MYIISYLKMQNGTCPLLHDGSESVEFESLERAYEFYTDECRLTEFCNKKMGGGQESTPLSCCMKMTAFAPLSFKK